MKALLLFACLLLSAVLYAQDTTIVKRNNETITIIRTPNPTNDTVKSKPRLFDIGLGCDINSLNNFTQFYGPLVSFRANHKNGRLAGFLNASYCIGNTFQDRSYAYFMHYNEDEERYKSDIQYNFLKLNLGIQIPILNRTNKKGFSLSALLGVSYYNGMGSGSYLSYLDKPNAPAPSPSSWGDHQSHDNFTFANHNLELISLDVGLCGSYTFNRCQLFINSSLISYKLTDDLKYGDEYYGGTFTAGYNEDETPKISVNLNFGIRYCLYTPWQKSPPDRLLRY